jgi:seryl-tRNA synthetase
MTEVFNEEGDPLETFDEDGNPIEVLSKSEAEAKIEEVKLESEQRTADLTDKMEELKSQIADKSKEMGKEDDKSKNFNELRKSRNDLQAELEATKKELSTYRDDSKKEIENIKQTISGRALEDKIKETVGNDSEMVKKVKFHFNNFKADEETDPVKREKNVEERIKSAFILAGGGNRNIIGDVAGTSGGFVPSPPGEATQDTPEGEVKGLGLQKMGLSDKDFREHKKAKGIL